MDKTELSEKFVLKSDIKMEGNQIEKKKLLILIDNLNRGGAEVLLVGTLQELQGKFEVILVTLTDECKFELNQIYYKYHYVLNKSKKISFFNSVSGLKRIVKRHNPDIIHAHLFYSSLIARIVCPSATPLFYSLHNEMGKKIFNNSRFLTFLEKATIKRNHSVIAVSKFVLEDYKKIIKKPESSYVLRNYISDDYLDQSNRAWDYEKNEKIKIVALGNIKDQKNYAYLIQAFRLLKEYNISIDIYGVGEEKYLQALQSEVLRHNLPIYFRGSVSNPIEVLPRYDLYVSCSKYEGFGIATIEAMALGLPLLLSDLPVYHEITFNNALFFSIENPNSFSELMKRIVKGEFDLKTLSSEGIRIAKKYSRRNYLENLFRIYETHL